jgi:hypothetical protein
MLVMGWTGFVLVWAGVGMDWARTVLVCAVAAVGMFWISLGLCWAGLCMVWAWAGLCFDLAGHVLGRVCLGHALGMGLAWPFLCWLCTGLHSGRGLAGLWSERGCGLVSQLGWDVGSSGLSVGLGCRLCFVRMWAVLGCELVMAVGLSWLWVSCGILWTQLSAGLFCTLMWVMSASGFTRPGLSWLWAGLNVVCFCMV